MPRRKPKKRDLSKEQELALKNKLDGIVLADQLLSGISAPEIPPMAALQKLNVEGVKSEVEAEARSILEALSKFYNDTIDLPDDHYIKHKQKIDAMNISTMAFQIRTSQHAITKLIKEIDSNPSNPRLFEVLAQLQNQLMQMPKNFSSYMSQMEKSYKELKSEYEEMKNQEKLQFNEKGELIPSKENLEALKVRGTRSLMENLQILMKKNDMIKNAEIIKPDNDLINPKKEGSSELEMMGGDDAPDFEVDEIFE